jgi:hypothetical protein
MDPHPELNSEGNAIHLRSAAKATDKAPKIPDPNYVQPWRTALPPATFAKRPRRSPWFLEHSICIVSISLFIMLPLAVCQSLVLSTAPYISPLFLLSTSVIAVNLAAPLANPPEGETSTSGAQLEKPCVTSLECVSMVLHRGLLG